MNFKETLSALSFIGLFVFIGFLTGTLYGDICATKRMQSRATAAGVAYWVVDPKTGSTVFTWGVR